VSLPFGLRLYCAGTALAAPLAPLALARRADRGKEDPARIDERKGVASAPRPEGRLAWIHAAGVGESLVGLTLARALTDAEPNLEVLLTSGTRTSAELVADRLPDRTRHQYAPVDAPGAARRFIDHWRPDLAVFVESELWPNLLIETAKSGAATALVNARMNAASLKRWGRWEASARRLLGAFDWIGAADRRTAEGLSTLAGREVGEVGNLKLEADPPPPDPDALAAARAAIGDRPVFVAASTHEDEEVELAAAHLRLRRDHADALMILAPRHPERAEAVAEILQLAGLTFARRSAGETPAPDTAVWLADTLGEMGLWFALAPAAFIAGSLVEAIGGHNPVEATRAGAAVITGPHVDSFADVYATYRATGAVAVASDAAAIAAAVEQIWAGGDPTPEAGLAALERLSGDALETTVEALRGLLNRERES
jgi:3-deoxy-D-manno-octulosonic-acid transferase